MRSSETVTNGPVLPSLPEGITTYDYNIVDQLLSTTNPLQTITHDADGNLTRGYTPEGYVFTATYDAEDRMTSLEYTDSGSIVHRTEYRYSGDGFLAIIRKFENSSLVDEIRIVRDGVLAIQDRDENNTVEREYTWGLNLGGGIGGLLNLKQGGQDYVYLYDGKGNVAAVLDAAQSVAAAYRYAPFGELLAKTGSLTQPFGFSTKRYDSQTGLIYYGYRFYAPAIGRWTTRDPLGEAGGMNLYAFVGNNPVNWVDPWGEVALVDDAAILLAGGLLIAGMVATAPPPAREAALDAAKAGVAFAGNAVVNFPSNVANVAGQVANAAAYTAAVAGDIIDQGIHVVCRPRRPEPWNEKKPRTTPRDKDISKKPVIPIKEPRTPKGNGCAELERLIWDTETSPAVKSAARMLFILGGCGSLNF